MKKNVLFILLIILSFGLVACGSANDTNNNVTTAPNTASTTEPAIKPTDAPTDALTDAPTDRPTDAPTDAPASSQSQLVYYKNLALEKLNELVNPAIAKITNDELRTLVQTYYTNESTYINGINDLEQAKEAVNKIIADTKSFAKNELMPVAIEKLNSVVNPLIQNISYTELKTSVQSFYDNEMAKVSSVETLDDVVDLYKEILDDTRTFIEEETEKILVALKNRALEELDPYVTALINKIPYDTLKADTQTFYNNEKLKLEAVDSIEGVTPCVNEIKEDLETYAITETKKLAVSKLEEVVNAGLEKIANQTLKDDLTSFSNEEIAKLNAITNLEDVTTTLSTVLSETEAHIKELLISTVKDYLARLTAIENANAYDYLPSAMHPTYRSNVVSLSAINYDFTQTTNISNINHAGFGEQWQMVIENIEQTVKMGKVFNVISTVLTTAGNAVDIYLENSFSDEIDYSFSGENYTGKFEFKGSKLIFNITVTKSVDIPILGSFAPIIKMEYDLAQDAKGMYISLGDAYKVKYVVSQNLFEMATTYGITVAEKEVSRSSYLSISTSDNKTTGHIYEYTTYEGSDKIKACADFYIENGYVSVVGNKASGMLLFDGYVNELYKADEGRLLGYEVREEKEVLGVKGTYNTLWFNLWDISGITSVKVTDKTNANKSSRSTVDVYLNGSESLLVPTYNTKLTIKTSRKYDIELRSRFYYTYDSENDRYVANELKVPMMFIQEDNNVDTNFSDYPADMLKDNSITSSVTMNQTDLNKVLADYDTLIDIFIRNKENMSSEQIIAYLEQYE